MADAQIQETFSFIDKDGDNIIKRDELKGFMANLDAENFIMTEDTNHNGNIEFSEFYTWAKISAMETFKRNNIALEVMQVFDMLDSNHDGFLSSNDLQFFIANTDEIRQMIRY